MGVRNETTELAILGPPGRAMLKQGGSKCQIKKKKKPRAAPSSKCSPGPSRNCPHSGRTQGSGRNREPGASPPRRPGDRRSAPSSRILREPGSRGSRGCSEGVEGGSAEQGRPGGGACRLEAAAPRTPAAPQEKPGRAPRRGSYAGRSLSARAARCRRGALRRDRGAELGHPRLATPSQRPPGRPPTGPAAPASRARLSRHSPLGPGAPPRSWPAPCRPARLECAAQAQDLRSPPPPWGPRPKLRP